MAEFIIVLPVLLLLILGSVQFALIWRAKSTLNLATFYAARSGALHRGNGVAMRNGLANGLMPLFARTDTDTEVFKAYLRSIQEVKEFARIEIIHPTPSLVDSFGETYSNDNLAHQRTENDSGMSLQDANLLKIKVTWCYPLIVPLIDKTILTAIRAQAADFNKVCTDAGRIPVHSHAIVRMQTEFCPACKS
jgi:hypothetical protein